MVSWIVFMFLGFPGLIFTVAQEGTVLKETCQFWMIQFYFDDDNPQETLRTKTIQRANETALESLKTFIDEPVECYNTKETYQKFTYKTGSFGKSQTLIAEVTFIISAQDNVTARSRSSVAITCREALNVRISAPNALPRLTALLPLNISGSFVNPFLVRADDVSCCQELYGQNKRECCRTGFIQIASNCACPPGKFLDSNMTKCEPCPRDTYQPKNATIKCEPCPPGTKTYDSVGSTNVSQCLRECKEGEFFDKVSWNCTKCPRNTTQNNKGQIDCKPCPGSNITEEEGTVHETDCIEACPAGEYYDKNQFSCEPCERGFYQPNLGTSKCLKCPNEREITFVKGAKTVNACVKACPPGSHHVNRTSQCALCTTDSYQDEFGQERCKNCQFNHKTLKENSTMKEDCLEVCEVGLYHHNATKSCQECEKNTYQPSMGQFRCLLCPEGTITEQTKSTSKSDCILDCQKGYYYDKNSAACVECPRGKYQPSSGTVKCSSCLYNETTLTTGTVSKTGCIPSCEKGSFYNVTTQGCTTCPAGQTMSTNGSINSDECFLACDPGQFYNFSSKMCEKCHINTYQEHNGQIGCIACEDGKITVAKGSNSTEDCIPGNTGNTSWNVVDTGSVLQYSLLIIIGRCLVIILFI